MTVEENYNDTFSYVDEVYTRQGDFPQTQERDSIPANSHACGLKTSISRRLTLAGQFLTPD